MVISLPPKSARPPVENRTDAYANHYSKATSVTNLLDLEKQFLLRRLPVGINVDMALLWVNCVRPRISRGVKHENRFNPHFL